MKRKRQFILLDWLRNLVNKVYPESVGTKSMYDDMDDAMDDWMSIYKDSPSWYDTCHGKTLNLGATIASEFARLITIEFKSEITGSARAEFLQKQYERLLEQLRVRLEAGCAVGGIVFKPYVRNGVILPDCITQDKFIHVDYGNGVITSAVFIDQQVKGKYFYTRLEKQTYSYEKRTHTIESHFFISQDPDNLGKEIDYDQLNTEMWTGIDPIICIEGVDRPLFAFWKVPFANQIDTDSPLGVSVYSRSIRQIMEADLQWDRFLWEFEGGELAVDAGEEVLRPRPGVDGKIKLELPKTKDRLFRKFSISSDDDGKSFFQPYNPVLRDISYANGLDKIIRKIEFNCSLAYGTISDPTNVDKTAEEIRSSKQRSYAAINDMQTSLESVLEDYIYACDVMATVCHLAPAGDYETSFNWGDGVLEDGDKEQAIRLNEVNSGLLSKVEYLKWRYGLTDEQAQNMLPQQQTESFFDDEGGGG